jgi:AmmeMemoRadiSam system protein B/AmmeMemoRadiSam system protein A
MNKKNYFINLLIVFVLFCNCCSSQDKTDDKAQNHNPLDKQPDFAGQFYPSDKEELNLILANLYKNAVPGKFQNVLAVISPHAGYIYSGGVAASGFNQIDTEKFYNNVFIIASSHTSYFEGASIFTSGDFITPLGRVKVNTELAEKLSSENRIFNSNAQAFKQEHSVEVQLPFLQYKLKDGFRIVPIVIGTQSQEDCHKIAVALQPYFNESNLFVVSSDFSHYPGYKNAVIIDKKTAESILTNDPDMFLSELSDGINNNVPGLATRACGWTSILTLLYLTTNIDDLKYDLITYQNSGDTKYGDSNRVVGYNSIVVSKKLKEQSDFYLTDTDKKDLLNIARITIESYISENNLAQLKSETFSDAIKTKCGAFVTLKMNDELRGCIGRFDQEEPLFEVVQQMAIASSTQDKRFVPVSKSELQKIIIEISVLTPLKKIESVNEIELGKNGIYIKKGNRSGTFLPQVATETGWNHNEFLGHCSRDKAGLGWDGWKDAEIYVYEAIVFSE